MNKDFEKEYRKYSADNAPDLWDRIEAGIDAAESGKPGICEEGIRKHRSVNTGVCADGGKKAENSGNGAKQQEKIVRIGEKKGRKLWKYSGWVAAAVCALLVIPAVLRPGHFETAAPAEAAHADQMAVTAAAAAAEEYAAPAAEETAREAAAAPVYAAPAAENTAGKNAAPTADGTPVNALKEAALPAGQMAGHNTAKAAGEMDAAQAGEMNAAPAAVTEAGRPAETEEERIYLRAELAEEPDARRERPAIDAAGPDADYASFILLTPEEQLYDIRILKISADGITENGELTVREAELLYEEESAGPETPLLIRVEFMSDTLPEYAVSFKDGGGEPKSMAIQLSGKDGSLLLTPVRIKKQNKTE